MAVAATYTGYVQAFASGGTLTVPAVPIGAADANRRVVAVVWATGLGSPASIAFTIGGVAASVDRPGGSGQLFVVSATVPAGTTADVQLSVSPAAGFTALRAYAFRLIGPVSLHDAVAASVSAPTISAAIAETPGGATIAGAFSGNVGAWTYPPQAADEIAQFSVGLASASGSGSTVQVARGGSGTIYLVAVHYRETGASAAVDFTFDELIVEAQGGAQGATAEVDFTFDELVVEATSLAQEAAVDFTFDELIVEATNLPTEAAVDFTFDELIVEAAAGTEVPQDQFWRALFARNTAEVVVLLLTLSHPAEPEPRRFAYSRPGHDIISNGAAFRGIYFEPTWVSDGDRAVRIGLRVPNVDRKVGALLDGLDEAPTVRMDLVLASNPNKIVESAPNLRLINARWGAAMVEGELGYRDTSGVPYGALAATPAYARALHK